MDCDGVAVCVWGCGVRGVGVWSVTVSRCVSVGVWGAGCEGVDCDGIAI